MSEEYCVGVKILLERMDTNPEEFIAPFNQIKGARWSNLMSGIIAHKLEKDVRGDANFLTDTEVDAVFDKYKVLRRKAFDDHILREVLGADEQLSSPSPPVSVGALRWNKNTNTHEVLTGTNWENAGKTIYTTNGTGGQTLGTNVLYTGGGGGGALGQAQLGQGQLITSTNEYIIAQRQAFMAQQQLNTNK